MTWKKGRLVQKKKDLLEKAPPGKQTKVFLKALRRPCQAPEGGPEKMQSLSHAVHTNTYRIDCRKLADCLIAGLLMGFLR
jgi:hypothetical protein